MNKYLRLIRFSSPFGWILLYLPCVLGILLGAFKTGDSTSFYLYIKFLLGAFLTRSAGCIINDILDRNFDGKVERSKNRPIVRGEISIKSALIFMCCLLFGAFLILLTLPLKVMMIGIFSLILMFSYPLFKRITHYPQIVLGFAFNIGIFMGFYSAAPQSAGMALLLPYVSLIIWTVTYDTLYAMQDIRDDLSLGLKSTAIKFGKNYKAILCGLSLIFLLLLIIFYHIFKLNYSFLICSISSFLILNIIILQSKEGRFQASFELNSLVCVLLCIGAIA